MVEQNKAETKRLTLYFGGFAHILAEVRAQDGSNQITGVSSQMLDGTFHPALESQDVVVQQARVLEPTTLDEIIEANKGKAVKSKDGRTTATLLSMENGLFILSNDPNRPPVFTAPISDYLLNNFLPDGLRNFKSLGVVLSGVKSENLAFGYLTKGINLTPHYNVLLTDQGLVLKADALIQNESGESYKTQFEIIPGNVGLPHFSGGVRAVMLYRMESRRVEEVDYLGGVDESEEKGQIVYGFGEREIPVGKSSFGIFTTKPLEYKIVYKANLGRRDCGIDTCLRFKAPKNLHQGAVAVYTEATQESRERYEGGSEIRGSVLKGQDVDISLRTPDTLKVKTRQVDQTEIVETDIGSKGVHVFAYQRQYEVTLTNSSQEEVVMELYLGLSETQSVLNPSLAQHEQSSGTLNRWDVSVPAGSETKFTYTVQDAQFQPVPRDVLVKQLR